MKSDVNERKSRLERANAKSTLRSQSEQSFRGKTFSPLKEKLTESNFFGHQKSSIEIDDVKRMEQEDGKAFDNSEERKCIWVYVYGFSSSIHALMAASDMIVTKAGPGTIAEANTRGLPVLISSYLPGQEEGNVSFVLENKFGTYCVNPQMIGIIVREWLTNSNYKIKLNNMSVRSLQIAKRTASLQIAQDLGHLLGLCPIITDLNY